MFKFLIGFAGGLSAGLLLWRLLPPAALLFMGAGLVLLMVALFVLFHLGVQDFQDY